MIIVIIISEGETMMCAKCLRRGQKGTICGIDMGHRAASRLVEMGFTPGSRLEVIGSSPFGDPLMLSLRGYSVAVRKRDLEALTVDCAEGLNA